MTWISFSIVLVMAGLVSNVWAQETLDINTGFNPPISTDNGDGFSDRLIKEAVRRIGYAAKMHRKPPQRAITEANSGRADGDGPRVAGLQKKFPNLVMVEESLFIMDVVVFSKNRNIEVLGYSALADKSTAILIGRKNIQYKTAAFANRFLVRNVDSLVEMVNRGHADIGITDRRSGLLALHRLGIDGVYVLDPPLEQMSLHLYLHMDNLNLADDLSRALKEMKGDGTYESIMTSALSM